ncbi:MAG: response regulator, partial [Myxococcota bacterium]
MAREALVSVSDPTTLQQTAALLARAGYRVESTSNGEKAVSICLAQVPSLVVCSERLSELSGIQLCQALRETGTAARLILLCSRPLERIERQELAADIGCDAVICHPFRASDLEAVLRLWDLLPATEPEIVAASYALPVPIPLPLPIPIPLPLPIPIPLPLPVSARAADPAPQAAPPAPEAEPPTPTPASEITFYDASPPNLNVLDEAAEILDARGDVAPTLLPPTVPRVNDLRAMPLPRLLYELYVGTYFGIVHLRREGVRRAIYFWAGMPVRVDTDQVSESLGSLLVESQRLSEADHDRAQQHAVAHGTHLGAALVALGLLRESELLDALSMQTGRKLISTLAWRHGTYEIVDDIS